MEMQAVFEGTRKYYKWVWSEISNYYYLSGKGNVTASFGWTNPSNAFTTDRTTYASCGTASDFIDLQLESPVRPMYMDVRGIYASNQARIMGLRIYSVDNNGNETLLGTTNPVSTIEGSNEYIASIDCNEKEVHHFRFRLATKNDSGDPPTTTYPTRISLIRILRGQQSVKTEATASDYDFYEDVGTYQMPSESTIGYYKENEYTTAGTYTYNITTAGNYLITLIGGGGGSAQVDGGVDSYSDTDWSYHYGHSGGNGGRFEGWANLGVGTLSITIGAVGTNRAGKGNTSGNGGDSYAIYTPENGSPVEIARAGGGHSGYPEGSSFGATVPGGTVTYNSNYFTQIIMAQQGTSGKRVWTVHI